MIVGSAYAINLATRPDRRERLIESWPLAIALNFFNAIQATPGTLGCYFSHLALLSTTTEPTLVVEDDAVFTDFTLDLTPPGDWEILWLGRQIQRSDPVDETWVRPRISSRTHAYAVRHPELIYSMIKNSPGISIDSDLHGLPVAQYALKTGTVGQGAGVSDITGHYRAEDTYWN